MKVTVSLGKIKTPTIKDPNATVDVPFWFTTDRMIHLGGEVKSIEVETDLLPLNLLREFTAGLGKGQLISDNEDAFYKAIEAITKTQESKTQKVVERGPASPERLAELKKNRHKAEAAELVSKPLADIAKVVGSATIEDGAMLAGLFDVNLLNAILDAEKDKSRPRKQVLTLVEKRIAALHEVKINVTQDDLMTDVEEVDDKKIIVTHIPNDDLEVE